MPASWRTRRFAHNELQSAASCIKRVGETRVLAAFDACDSTRSASEGAQKCKQAEHARQMLETAVWICPISVQNLGMYTFGCTIHSGGRFGEGESPPPREVGIVAVQTPV